MPVHRVGLDGARVAVGREFRGVPGGDFLGVPDGVGHGQMEADPKDGVASIQSTGGCLTQEVADGREGAVPRGAVHDCLLYPGWPRP